MNRFLEARATSSTVITVLPLKVHIILQIRELVGETWIFWFLTTSIVAPINIAFVVTSAPTGKSILKVSVSVKLSAHNPLHFLEISPTEIPPEFSICKRLNHSPKKEMI